MALLQPTPPKLTLYHFAQTTQLFISEKLDAELVKPWYQQASEGLSIENHSFTQPSKAQRHW